MKWMLKPEELKQMQVAPFVGAWIEMVLCIIYKKQEDVAPFVGAWIEIPNSHRRRKSLLVAPFVGAWIEIIIAACVESGIKGRSLRGSVD